MEKFGQLTAFLESLDGVTRDQMESFVSIGRPKPTGRDLGQGFEIGRFQYDAVIGIDRFPAEIATTLIVLLIIWLWGNDPDREQLELEDPEIEITPLDDQTVFVEITVVFDESLFIVPDPQGTIPYDGQMWRISSVPVDVAESLDSMEKA
ncbi:phage tail protein [Desulfosediminicola sp.]|uniref:phage tail protein n=1 Tax=Desulfosediminicola sp. TaxID=2886825 RepID=UPI003AF22C19